MFPFNYEKKYGCGASAMCVLNAVILLPLLLLFAAYVVLPFTNSSPLTAGFRLLCFALIALGGFSLYQGTRQEILLMRYAYFGAAAVSIGTLITAGIRYDKMRLAAWCEDNRYKLLSSGTKGGPGPSINSRTQRAHFVQVRDHAGTIREGWVVFGDRWGFHPDQIEEDLYVQCRQRAHEAQRDFSKFRPVLVTAAIVLAVGWGFYHQETGRRSLEANGTYAVGHVVHKEIRKPSFLSKASKRPYLDIRFTDEEGIPHNVSFSVSKDVYNRYSAGSKVRIKYDRTKPENMAII